VRRKSLNGWWGVQSLLFPVKLRCLVLGFIAFLLLIGCGYQPAYEARSVAERLSVAPADPRAPRSGVVHAALAGARSELSRAGQLASGTGYPRMVVEVLRIDEQSSGIAAPPPQPGQDRTPLARGSTVGVLGRAWVEREPGGSAQRDTGDLRRVETYGGGLDSVLESVRHDEAVRAAARELGRALARRILGEPEPDVEPI
jgi:hypothetical protein